jgi:ribosome maturation factor RimP
MAVASAQLRKMLEPGVQGQGFELVEVELSGTGRHTLLRVYIDSPAGVTVDDCARVSNQLSAILDVEDLIDGRYTLEVSSPGLDRPLVKPEDFTRFTGEMIKVLLGQPLSGRKNFKGRLIAVAPEHVVLGLDGETLDVAFDRIEKARLIPKF